MSSYTYVGVDTDMTGENTVTSGVTESRVGQLSEVNLESDTLSDMVSIMVNNHVYKPPLKVIMDKYYEMFRGKNQGNNTDLINRTEDSDTDPEPKLPDPPCSWGT